MPRQGRLDNPRTVYHVMMRGIERKKIFRDDHDWKDFVSRLSSKGDVHKFISFYFGPL